MSSSMPFFHAIVCSFFSFLLCNAFLYKPGNYTDHQALLSFKASIVKDPLQFTVSWNESTHFCEWIGITCSRKHQRVTKIDLHSSKLEGFLSPSIGNMSFLRQLLLYNNSFRGLIPEEIGRLTRLQVLNLTNNSFSGEIPKNISSCFNLIDLSLGTNNLTGRFPLEFQSFFKLQYLGVFQNNLVGEIPSYIGNFSSLLMLSLSHNNFEGKIPNSLGQLNKLLLLFLGYNNLSGPIPSSIFNLSSLESFSVSKNQLQGYLPSNIGSTLPSLKLLHIRENRLIGPLPASVSNATRLQEFDVAHNGFNGGVPTFSGLKQLRYLGLGDNPLGNGKSTDLDFMSSLLNSTSTLQKLFLYSCNFGGVLPSYIGNFSSLILFGMFENVIYGDIPSELHLLVNLEGLSLSGNQFSGNIPSSLGSLQLLFDLDLAENKLSGEIPSSLGNMSILSKLFLRSNNLHGTIPPSLGKSKFLFFLDLSENKLNSHLPKEIFNPISPLVYIDLSHNHFTGSLPLEIGGLKNLVSLNLSNNMLSGELPNILGTLTGLNELNFSSNFFHGYIPPSFSSLKSLQRLDLSSNNLTGKIPEFLGKFQYLNYLNLSFNDLDGEIPTEGVFKSKANVELEGNINLCGGIPLFGLPKCPRQRERQHLSHSQKLAIFISSGTLILTFVAFFVFSYKWKNKRSSMSASTIVFIPKLSYWSLHKATAGFSESNIIGTGKFSTVYKGILDDGLTTVAIKVLKLQVRGVSKSFLTECETLGQIRHRNLVKILSSCSSIDHEGNDFMAIVYEHMANGSLDNWVHNDSAKSEENHDLKNLNLLQRVNISIDVANALDYLHNHLERLLVHCDLKPSNILLDGDFVAHVGDFGLARFLPKASHVVSSSQMSSQGLKGTIGYAAPEYGMGSEFSTFGDMYSYGILLLKIFTGKSPTSDIFNNGMTLHNYVKMAIPQQVMEISDQKLFHKEVDAMARSFPTQNVASHQDRIVECLLSIYNIGIACSVESPRDRMDIGSALTELCVVRDTVLRMADTKTIPK